MPTTGAYEFRLALASKDAVIEDENQIGLGCWAWIDRTADVPGSRRWLMLYARCPDCGLLCTLWRVRDDASGHQIDAHGNLSPSVQCPHEPCGFHTQPTRLQGFVDRRTAPV